MRAIWGKAPDPAWLRLACFASSSPSFHARAAVAGRMFREIAGLPLRDGAAGAYLRLSAAAAALHTFFTLRALPWEKTYLDGRLRPWGECRKTKHAPRSMGWSFAACCRSCDVGTGVNTCASSCIPAVAPARAAGGTAAPAPLPAGGMDDGLINSRGAGSLYVRCGTLTVRGLFVGLSLADLHALRRFLERSSITPVW